MNTSRLQAWLAAAILGVVCVGASDAATVIRFRLDDNIHPASQTFVERCLGEANARSADLVVLELDTPGGLVEPTRDMTGAITSSRVPVVVWVTPAGARAASAGFFLLIAADVAAMSPGTNTGAAHPVLMMFAVKEVEVSDQMRDKILNDVTAMVRSFAAPRGRNVDLAVRAVTESLSFTAAEALDQDLIDMVIGSFDELLDRLDGTEIRRFDGSTVTIDLSQRDIITLEPTPTEKLHSLLGNPLIVLLLMAVAAIGIFTEITHPGAVLPGVVGVIALLLFLYSTSILPVNWAGVGLIIVALALFILEVKVTSYGLLTISGLICFVLGSLMLFDAPIPDMRLSLPVVLPTAILVAAVMVFLVSRVVKAHQRRPSTGEEGLVGELGQAITDIAPDGKIKVHGEYWDARSSAPIAKGALVRVLALSGRSLEVEPAGDSNERG